MSAPEGMHYIRLLRPPALAQTGTKTLLNVVLTVTTDLGESFLCPYEPVELSFVLEYDTLEGPPDAYLEAKGTRKLSSLNSKAEDEPHLRATESTGPTVPTKFASHQDSIAVSKPEQQGISDAEQPRELSNEPHLDADEIEKEAKPEPQKRAVELRPDGKNNAKIWRAGLRVMKMNLLVPQRLLYQQTERGPARLRVQASDHCKSVHVTEDLLQAQEGLIMPVWVDIPNSGESTRHVSCRKLRLGDGCHQHGLDILVEEEIGESIARHVWDAGVVMVGLLNNICSRGDTAARRHALPVLTDLLLKSPSLNMLELGTGVGILGLGLAKILQCSRTGDTGRAVMVLTDLPEAEERALSNIALSQQSTTRDSSEAGNEIQIEYENLDWEEGRKGLFGPRVKASPPDIVILSDCTYNVDMLPALVETLSAVHALSAARDPQSDPKVLLATKPRHCSEKVLFQLMAEARWKIEEQVVLPLPVLAGEDEQVEVYLFSRG